MGHKSLETTMRYLAPATDVHNELDVVTIPTGREGRSGAAKGLNADSWPHSKRCFYRPFAQNIKHQTYALAWATGCVVFARADLLFE
jgi:hypothetical protein